MIYVDISELGKKWKKEKVTHPLLLTGKEKKVGKKVVCVNFRTLKEKDIDLGINNREINK